MKDVRPTSGRVLLALFSILGALEGLSFLDLFAGTGRVGVEALKRGASLAVMVEVVKERARGIELAVSREPGTGEAAVLSMELRRAIAWLVRRSHLFDVIFADPPYNDGWGASLLRTKGMEKILKQGGVLVVEHASRETLNVPSIWEVKDVRVYGETALTFVEHKIENPGGISS